MAQTLTLQPFDGVICSTRVGCRQIPARFRDHESLIPRLPKQTSDGVVICFPFDTEIRERIIDPYRFGDNEAVLLTMKYLYFNNAERKWSVSELVIYPDTTLEELEKHCFKVPFFTQ